MKIQVYWARPQAEKTPKLFLDRFTGVIALYISSKMSSFGNHLLNDRRLDAADCRGSVYWVCNIGYAAEVHVGRMLSCHDNTIWPTNDACSIM